MHKNILLIIISIMLFRCTPIETAKPEAQESLFIQIVRLGQDVIKKSHILDDIEKYNLEEDGNNIIIARIDDLPTGTSYQNIDEYDLANKDYIANYHPICARTCVDFYLKEKTPYIGLHWMVSHNLLISAKTALMNDVNNDIYSHNRYGFDLDLISKDNYDLILSFDINKSLYNDDSNYSWYQTSLIYLKRLDKGNLQIILDSNYDEDWSENRLNLIYRLNISKDIFFNI